MLFNIVNLIGERQRVAIWGRLGYILCNSMVIPHRVVLTQYHFLWNLLAVSQQRTIGAGYSGGQVDLISELVS